MILDSHLFKDDDSLFTKEIIQFLWNPSFIYLFYKKQPRMPILSPINPIHVVSYYFFEINFIIILPSTAMCRKRPLSFRFIHHISVCTTLFPIRATCLVHLILLYLTTPSNN